MTLQLPLIVLTCLCSTGISAQRVIEEEPAGLKHTIGLNTFGLLDQVFNNDADNRRFNPYLLTYSLTLDKLALRAGIGPEYQSKTTAHDGFTNSEEMQFIRIDGRVGAGYLFIDEPRWRVTSGLDLVYGYLRDRNIEDTGFDRITHQTKTESYGGGPFIEIAWFVSRRISLGTECLLYWTHGKSEEVELFQNFPDFNTIVSKTTIQELDFTLPNTIFLRIHF